jgi:hypothetical protein
MKLKTVASIVLAGSVWGAAAPALGVTLKEGAVACRTEATVLAHGQFERNGDELQRNLLIGSACLTFRKDMEATVLGESSSEQLVQIRISNGRREIRLWTLPRNLVVANDAGTPAP